MVAANRSASPGWLVPLSAGLVLRREAGQVHALQQCQEGEQAHSDCWSAAGRVLQAVFGWAGVLQLMVTEGRGHCCSR